MRNKLRQFHKSYHRQTKKQAKRFKRLRRHPLAIPLVGLVVIPTITIASLLLINSHSARFKPISSYIVIISHDNVQQIVPTREATVGALLAKLKLTLNQGDVVEPSLETAITQDNFRVNIYRAVPVEIIDGSQTTFALSAAGTPRSIAQRVGLTIYPEDDVTIRPVSNFLTQHSLSEQVIINRATPVNFNLYGTPAVIRTHAKTVAELLAAKNIKLAKTDVVQPAVSTPITPNIQVFVIREGIKLETVEQDIAMPTQTIEDDSLTFGTSAIRQQGSPGKQLITYQDNLQNGVVVSRTQIQVVVTVQPVTQIVARGRAVQIPADKEAVMAEAGIASNDYPYVNYIMSNESGWCPTKVQGEIGYCPPYAPSDTSILSEQIGYGLGQATPGNKMASFGSDWETNPVTQLHWATAYANTAKFVPYGGGWLGAYNYWQAHHNW